MKRITAILLLLAVLCGSFTVYATADAENAEPARYPFLIYSTINPEEETLLASAPYDDSLFSAPATQYNHTLAQASLGLAMSNFREKGLEPDEQGYAIRDFLTEIGFTDLQADQYDVDTTSDTVASTIGRKETVINGEACTLIAVSVCGFGYQNEWLSNFTFSKEERHTGFDRAADKVLGRLLLYLYNHSSDKPVKIWISGYSRAAAISNLLGQKLSNEKLVPVNDLYVYTFATPNTSTAEGDWPCPSVFNIVGSFDPVPAVPPAEWGYTRYGTTFYLPAQEVDSDYRLHRAGVETIYRELTGRDYWNNPVCNWFVQKLLQNVYANVQSAEVYDSFLKNIISEMWVTSGVLPRIRLLNTMMSDSSETDSSMRSLFLSVKNMASPFLYNVITHSADSGSVYWGKDVSLQTQLLHEHYPDVYYAWMMSTDNPADLFITSPSFVRIALPNGLRIESVISDETGTEIPVTDLATVSFSRTSIVNIPGNGRFTVRFVAEKDMSGGDLMIVNEYRLPSLEATASAEYLTLQVGDRVQMTLDGGVFTEFRLPGDVVQGRADIESMKAHVDPEYENEAAMAEYVESGWLSRNLVDLMLWVPVVLVALLVFVIIRGNIRKKEGVFHARRAFVSLMCVFFAIGQVLLNVFPWGVLLIIICQGICSVSAALISFFAWLRRKDRYSLMLLAAMFFWTAGDALSRAVSLLSTVFFGIGHLILAVAFFLEHRPGRRQIIILAAATALVFTVELMIPREAEDMIISMVYGFLALAMAVFSGSMGKANLAGGLLFVISDLVLLLRELPGAYSAVALLSLGLYYGSVAVLSSVAYGEAKKRSLA
ncbi:MAG: lysoplasmalogenase family protein [Clostridia bacterium]|nr:lysoplasmalogenase family protein [Clostridia bacterium]